MVVGYTRLSRDEDKENYTSIEEQHNLIYRYAEENHLHVSNIYTDDGYSGYIVKENDDTKFDRPDFTLLMDDVKSKHIDTILVKDISRLGRRQAIVLLTLERLKSLGCKCIDISTGSEALNDFSGVYTWVSEMYIKDISKKVRMSVSNRQRTGRCIMGNYFGYIKKNKTELIIDEDLRPCIELIFHLYLNGMGYAKVANYLNDNTSYPTPSKYYTEKFKEQGRIYKHKLSTKWETSHIVRILDDDVYTGILRTHKRYIATIKGKQKRLPKNEHFLFENHHEAIVSKTDFDMVQELRIKRANNSYRNGKVDYLFSGFGVCGDCSRTIGGNLRKLKNYNKIYYNCANYINYGNKYCSSKQISEDDLVIIFRQYLKTIRKNYFDFANSKEYENRKNDLKAEKQKVQEDLTKAEQEYRNLMRHKHEELDSKDSSYYSLIQSQYQIMENESLLKIQRLQNHLNILKERNTDTIDEKVKTFLTIIDEVIDENNRPNKKQIEILLKDMVFYKDHIQFNLKSNIDNFYL